MVNNLLISEEPREGNIKGRRRAGTLAFDHGVGAGAMETMANHIEEAAYNRKGRMTRFVSRPINVFSAYDKGLLNGSKPDSQLH